MFLLLNATMRDNVALFAFYLGFYFWYWSNKTNNEYRQTVCVGVLCIYLFKFSLPTIVCLQCLFIRFLRLAIFFLFNFPVAMAASSKAVKSNALKANMQGNIYMLSTCMYYFSIKLLKSES